MSLENYYPFDGKVMAVEATMPSDAVVFGGKRSLVAPSMYSLEALANAVGPIAWSAKLGDYIGIYDVVHLVTDKPDPDDPDTWDWTAALQELFDLAVSRKIPVVMRPGRYRATAPLKFGSGFVYHGNGATLVKDFESVGYSDALLATEDTFSVNKVSNVILNDLWLAEDPGVVNGSLLTCGFLQTARINGLVARKTSGSWCFVLSGEDIIIAQANIDVTTALLYGDGLHITQGANIKVVDSIIRSNSDDAIAVHPHQHDWTVNGQFDGIDNILVANCTLESPTNAFRVGAEAYALGAGGVDWAIDNVVVRGCRLVGGVQMRDERDNTHPVNGRVLFENCVLTDDVTISSPDGGGTPRWTEVQFHRCKLTDAVASTSPALSMAAAELAVGRLILSECIADRHVIAVASQEVRAPGLRVTSDTTGNAVEFRAPVVDAPGMRINGAGTEFRGVTIGWAAGITYANFKDLKVSNVQRGVSIIDPIAFCDLTGAYYENCSVSNIGFTAATTVRAELTASATYDPASLADGAGVTTTVTVTGAAVGDYAQASFGTSVLGMTITAYVSSTNTVSVRFQNESGGVLDLASGTIRVRVVKA